MDVWLRDGDWRMPVRTGGVLEFFDGLTLCGECDARVLLESLAVHVRMARIVRVIQDGTIPTPPLPRKPLAPPLRGTITPERKAELRDQRKSRKRSTGGLTMRIAPLAALLLVGCASTAAVQNRPTAPRVDTSAAQLTSDQAACEKTAQETRPSHYGRVAGMSAFGLVFFGVGAPVFGLVAANSSNSDYEELYVQCMRAKNYAFPE